MQNKRVYVDNWANILDGAISDSDTTIVLTNNLAVTEIPNESFGANGFYLILTLYDGTDVECIKVETKASDDKTLNDVIRGALGTTPIAWPDLTTIQMRATSDSLVGHDTMLDVMEGLDMTQNNTPDFYDCAIVQGRDGPGGDVDALYTTRLQNIADLYSLNDSVETADWVNDDDDTLAITPQLIPTNEMVKAYVDASGGGGGSGDVVGPSSSADNEVAVFDSTTGKLLKRPTTAGVVISAGGTGQRGSSNSMIRVNTDNSHVEVRIGGFWTGNQFLMDSDIPGAGLMVKTADLTYANRSIVGGTSISVTNGSGVGGSPTIAINTSWTGQSAIDTLGTITTGTWNGTAIGTAYGGTGLTSLGTGVATFLGTPSSANLAAAVTGETGSGALVFATSPALTTPDLGTPSAATLTNATGLPISTGVSGLASGAATFLATPSSANLRTLLTDEVGTGAAYFVGGALGTPASGTATNLTGLPPSGLTGQKPIIQEVFFSTGSVATGTTVIPFDDTIPQNTEGTEFMSLSITPTNTNNILTIEVILIMSNSAAANNYIVALFQDSTANALATTLQYGSTSGAAVPMPLIFRNTAGTTSATTFKVRAGGNLAGTTTINGVLGSRYFGGSLISSIKITEMLP